MLTSNRNKPTAFSIGSLLTLMCLMLAGTEVHAGWTASSTAGQSMVGISGQPIQMALASQARVLAIGNCSQPGVSFVNPDSGSIIKTVALTSCPRALVINAAGTTAYVVTNDAVNTVRVIDVASGNTTANWAVGTDMTALVLNANGSELIAADGGAMKLLGIDPSTGVATRNVVLTGNPLQLSLAANDQRLLVGLQSGALLVLNNATWSLLTTFTGGEQIRSLGWWQTPGRAVTVQKYADGVSLVDIDNGVLAANPVALEADPDQTAIDQGNSLGYFSMRRDNEIVVLDLTLGQVKGRYGLPGRIGAVVFDPVSQALLVTQPQDNLLIKLSPIQSILDTTNGTRKLTGIRVNNGSDQGWLLNAN